MFQKSDATTFEFKAICRLIDFLKGVLFWAEFYHWRLACVLSPLALEIELDSLQ